MDCTCQASLSMGCPRQEYWSGSPFPTPGNLPNPETELTSAALAGGLFSTESPGKPLDKDCCSQSLSCVQLYVTPWTATCQAFLSITVSWSLLKLMNIESVMPSNHLILCCHLLPLSIFPGIRVFSKESVICIRWPKYWSFSFNISPSSGYSGLISFRIDCFDVNSC